MTVPMKFPILLRGAWFGINREFRDRLKQECSLTTVQYTVLRNLHEDKRKQMNQKSLSLLLSSNKNNSADLLNRMEEKGLVRRKENSSDHRYKDVYLTKRGEREFLLAREHAVCLQKEVLSLFPMEKQESLFSYFSRCNEALEEID